MADAEVSKEETPVAGDAGQAETGEVAQVAETTESKAEETGEQKEEPNDEQTAETEGGEQTNQESTENTEAAQADAPAEAEATPAEVETTETQPTEGERAENSAETTETTDTNAEESAVTTEPQVETAAAETTEEQTEPVPEPAAEDTPSDPKDGRRSGASSRSSNSSKGSHKGKMKNREKSSMELSEKDRAKYRQIFDRKAVDDRLDLKGFKILFRLMGEVLSAQDADTMFEEADKDDNGTVNFDEFCRLYSKFSSKEQDRKEGMLRSIDKLFPSNDGEPVALKKVEKLLLKLQKPNLDMRLVREKSDLNEKDVKYLVRSMDTDGNGLISKQEFVNTLCQHLEMEG